ncbi:MAG: phage virion morphogenesis protein [Spirochaetes bacterium]|nr:phage virion morphogenesis protein [Spirochaetota bacterium]
MSYSVQYDFTQVSRYFDSLGINAITELKDHIGNELVAVSMEAFENEADPETGKKWPVSNRADLQGGKTLSDTGKLKQSIAYDISGSDIKAGTPLVYGRIHMTGENIKAKKGYLKFKINGKFVQIKELKIPQRRFLGVPKDFINRIFGNPAIQNRFGAP